MRYGWASLWSSLWAGGKKDGSVEVTVIIYQSEFSPQEQISREQILVNPRKSPRFSVVVFFLQDGHWGF